MAELDARLEELEGFSDFIKEYNVRGGVMMVWARCELV